MPTIADIRKQYPQYEDLPDAVLLDGLYRKHYSDMPRDEFDAKITGLREAAAPADPNAVGSARSGALGALDTASFGFVDEAAAGLGYLVDKLPGERGRSYEELLATARGAQQRAQDDAPAAYIAGQIGGALGTAGGLAARGATLLKPGMSLGRTMGAGAIEGAGYGALAGAGSAEGGLKDRALGAGYGLATGIALGGTAPAVVAGIGGAVNRGVQAVKSNIGSPAQQARNRIIDAGRRAGLDDAAINQRLTQLGPEGMLVDALGASGQALARSTANVSPEAQAALEGASYGRMAGQNDRVVAQLERASGLPAGSRSTVDDLKEAAYAKVAPEINAAYAEARSQGFDIPLDLFEDIFRSPMGKQELRKAMSAAANRAATGDNSAASRLGILDQLKRGLDSRASVAGRAGDKNLAAQASALAKAVRDRIDETLSGGTDLAPNGSGTEAMVANPYARARTLRQQAYRTDEAFDLGDELASGRVALDAPRRAAGVAERDRQALAQGYSARQAENLLNKRGTPGAVDALDTRMQREAMAAALGENAAPVQRQLAAERQFGQTHRALTGNSSTARQLAQMGMTGAAGAGLGLYSGMDLTTAGLAGVGAALARKGAGAAVGALRSQNEAAVAPYMAEFLVANGLPATPQGALIVMRDPKLRRALARAVGLIGGGEAGGMVSTGQ